MNVKLAIANILFPFEKVFWSFWRTALRHQCVRFHKCAFYGSPAFLKIAANAMQSLYGLDAPLYDSLVKGDFVFWDEPAGFVRFRRHLGFSKPWLEWKEQGIIAGVVNVFLAEKILYSEGSVFDSREKTLLVRNNVSIKTCEWLIKHQFPMELIDSFRLPQRGKSRRLHGADPDTATG